MFEDLILINGNTYFLGGYCESDVIVLMSFSLLSSVDLNML